MLLSWSAVRCFQCNQSNWWNRCSWCNRCTGATGLANVAGHYLRQQCLTLNAFWPMVRQSICQIWWRFMCQTFWHCFDKWPEILSDTTAGILYNILIWHVFWHSIRYKSRHESIILWDILYKALLVLLWLHNLGLLRFVSFSGWPRTLVTPGSLCLLCFSVPLPPCNKWYDWFSTDERLQLQLPWPPMIPTKQGWIPFWPSHGFTQ